MDLELIMSLLNYPPPTTLTIGTPAFLSALTLSSCSQADKNVGDKNN
jgi:hypothetical protein